MPITIREPELEQELEQIAASQPIPVTKSKMATAMLREAIDFCRRTGEPTAWSRRVHHSQNAIKIDLDPADEHEDDEEQELAQPAADPCTDGA